MPGFVYRWEGPAEDVNNTLDEYAWETDTNWLGNEGNVPGVSDIVEFYGPIASSAQGNPNTGFPIDFALVSGSGEADGMIASGFVVLDGTFNFANGGGGTIIDNAGIFIGYETTLYIGPKGDVAVSGDVDFSNHYSAGFGFGVTLDVEGKLSVGGRLGATYATYVNVTGSLTVGLVAPDGTVGVGQDSVTLSVGSGGVFVDNGDFRKGSITVNNATATIGGTLTNGSVTAFAGGTVSVAAVAAGSSDSFLVEDALSGIGLGASATAGQFTLGGSDPAKNLSITAPLIVIDSALTVTGALTLDGETDLNASLQIGAGGSVDFANIVNATGAEVLFEGADTSITLSDDAFLTSGFAPVLRDFAAGDTVTLSGFSGLTIASEESVIGGDLEVQVEGELDGVPETFTLTFEGVNFGDLAASGDQITFETSATTASSFVWTGHAPTGHWEDPLNWADARGGGMVTNAPTATDYVAIAGGTAGATVQGQGAAHALTLSGRVNLQGPVKTDVASVAAGTSLNIAGGGSLAVDDDLAGAANVMLNVQNGSLKVGKAISVAAGDTVTIANGSIAAASWVAASGATTTATSLSIGPQASLNISGNMTSLGDKIALNGGTLQAGETTLGGDTVSLQNNSSLQLSGIAAKPGADNITIDGTSKFEVGFSSGASAGSFQLDLNQTFSAGGAITAPSIVNNGEIDIELGASETLTGALSGSGKEELIGRLTLAGAPATGTTIDFYVGTLTLGSDVLGRSGVFVPTLQQFNSDDVIDLQGLAVATVAYDSGSGLLTALDGGGNVVATFSAPSADLGGKTLTAASIAGGSLIFATDGGDTSNPPAGAGGGSFYWTGTSGSWDNAANWKSVGSVPGTIPGADDVAEIKGDEVITGTGNFGLLGLDDDIVLDGTFSASNSVFGVTLGANSTLTIASGGALQDGSQLILHNASVIDVSGTLSAGATTFGLGDVIAVFSGGQFSAASINYANTTGDPNAMFSVASGGSLALGPEAASAGQFVLANNQTLTGGGAIAAPQIVLDGALQIGAGDAETLTGALSGQGSISLGAGATLTVAGSADDAPSLALAFAGATGELVLPPAALAQPSNVFAPVIANFAGGDQIDLQGFYDDFIQSETFDGTNTTLTLGGTEGKDDETLQLTFAGQAPGIFPLSSDGAGGTLIGAARPGFVWQGNASDDEWSNAANWHTGPDQTATAAPGATDDATINLGSGGVTIGGVGAARTLTLGGYVGFQGATVTATSIATVAGANVQVNNAGSLSTTGAFGLQGGTLQANNGAFGSGAATLADDHINATNGGAITFASLTNPPDVGGAADNAYYVDATSSIVVGTAAAQVGAFVVGAGQTVSGGGSIQAPAIVIDGVLEVQTGDGENLIGAVQGSGELLLDYGLSAQLSGPQAAAAGPTIRFSGQDALFAAPSVFLQGGASSDIAGFSGPTPADIFGDTLILSGLTNGTIVSQDAVGANTILIVSGTYSGAAVTDQITFAGTYLSGKLTSQQSGANFDIKTTAVACYARGTRIATVQGEVAVEALAVGDLVVTASGERRPVRWLGHRRIDVARHPDPASVRPVRVAAHAFGFNQPHRDLWLSPGHNVASEGALMPISALVNGVSVAQVDVAHVEYWHVELDRHDILLAEGLPAESYLDTGNRTAFEIGELVEAHPDFAPKHWAETYLPLAFDGEPVARTKARLLQRLMQQGLELTEDADPHVVVDGRRIEPKRRSARRLVFVLPEGGCEIALRSRVFIPAHTLPESADTRALGLCVARLRVDGLEADLARLGPGWHAPEGADGRVTHRWTGGDARLPPGARAVVVELAGSGRYWRGAVETRRRA